MTTKDLRRGRELQSVSHSWAYRGDHKQEHPQHCSIAYAQIQEQNQSSWPVMVYKSHLVWECDEVLVEHDT